MNFFKLTGIIYLEKSHHVIINKNKKNILGRKSPVYDELSHYIMITDLYCKFLFRHSLHQQHCTRREHVCAVVMMF